MLGGNLSAQFTDMKPSYQGKVRDVYEIGNDKLLIVATDRISCFDFILPTPVPEKGKILTRISLFWFNYLKNISENHLISSDTKDIAKLFSPDELQKFEGRMMLVKKAKRVDIEVIVRGYLSGSAWKEYQKSNSVCGIKLPKGLKESEKLSEPIFTPSTKAPDGEHDININEKKAEKVAGKEIVKTIKEKSISIYKKASDYALSKGIIIADTKFEFGATNNKIILIDEVLTPDSSRFWDKEKYSPGTSQENFDKQFVRDYLITIKWDKQPPVPSLPEDIVSKTKQRYLEAERRLCG
jgi:phosphoribosylaminoimidazole-succinocarboxamide synthase